MDDISAPSGDVQVKTLTVLLDPLLRPFLVSVPHKYPAPSLSSPGPLLQICFARTNVVVLENTEEQTMLTHFVTEAHAER